MRPPNKPSLDLESRHALARLLTVERVAALGTLRQGAPFVSMVPFAVARDAAAFHIHISRLAQHTVDILADPRVGLLISARDTGAGDPWRLARLSIEGQAQEMAERDPEYEPVKARYLARFPEAACTLALTDFSFFRIVPSRARYVAGFGRIYDLSGAALATLAVGTRPGPMPSG